MPHVQRKLRFDTNTRAPQRLVEDRLPGGVLLGEGVSVGVEVLAVLQGVVLLDEAGQAIILHDLDAVPGGEAELGCRK